MKTAALGLEKAVAVFAGVFGPALLLAVGGLLFLAIDALDELVDPESDPSKRLIAAAAWECGTLLLLWALREAVLMPRATDYFQSLPLSASHRMRVDLLVGARCYSLLWLPIAWQCIAMLASGKVAASLYVLAFVVLALSVNFLLLRNRHRAALGALAAITAFALSPVEGVGYLARLTALLLGAYITLRAYALPIPLRRSRRSKNAYVDRANICSALVVPFLLQEMRSTFLFRLLAITGTVCGIALLLTRAAPQNSAAAGMIVIAAVASTLLYRVPGLCRQIIWSKLGFLNGQPRFQQRLSVFSVVVPSAIYLLVIALAATMTIHFTVKIQETELLIFPAALFSGTFSLGVIASRNGTLQMTWLLPVINAFSAIAMLMVFWP